MRKFERAAGAAQSTERLVSETTTDHLGRLVSITGPGVVEERRTYTVLPNGQTREAVTRGSATATAEQILSERIVDALGRTVREKVNVPLGTERSWEYDAYGRVVWEKLGTALVREYVYSGAGITEKTHPSPDPMRTTVRSPRIETGAGGSYEVERVQTGNRFEERWTKLGLLAAGELGETKIVRNGGESITVKTEIDVTTRTITEKRYRAGAANPDITESRAGAVQRTTNGAEGTVVTRTVDVLGRPVTETALPHNRTTTYVYDYATGGVTSSSTSAMSNGAAAVLAFSQTYHPASDAAFGRVKTRTETGLTTNYVYSARGELLGTWGATYPVRYTYDLAGRLVKMETYRQMTSGGGSQPVVQWGAGDKTEWVYHAGTMALKQKKDAAGKGALYSYDPRGPLAAREWARLKLGSADKVTATYTHNALGELTGIAYNDGTPAVTLARDDRGRIVSIAEGGSTRSFAYNAQGLLAGESSLGFNPHNLTRGYDAVGRAQSLVLETAAGGVATWQGWDYHAGSGQVAGLSLPVGHMARGVYYGGQDVMLQLNAPQANGITTHRISDGFGRTTTTTTASQMAGTPPVPVNVTRQYSYNALNQRESMSDERSDKWLYTYDGKGQVTGGTKKWSTGLTGTDAEFAGQTVAGTAHSYSYDEIGNRNSWATPVGSGSSGSSGQVNNLNQTVWRYNGSSVEVTGEADPAPTTTVKVNTVLATRQARGYFEKAVSYANSYGGYYGEWRTVNVEETKAGQSPTAQSSHIWLPPQYESPTHDLDGNLTADNRWTYTWDAEHRLIGMETKSSLPSTLPRVRLTFRYDAHWRRVGKKVETKNASNVWVFTRELKYVYDRWNLIAEFEALPPQPTTFNLVRSHHWGPDLSGTAQGAGGVGGLVLTRNHRVANGANFDTRSYLPAYDGNGNIMALLDIDTAEKAAEYEYGPFGEPLRATGPMAKGNPFRFSTKYCDEETGLCYYGYRYYSPTMGRWINRDPAWEEGGFNLYGMVDNSPLTYVDILGLAPAPRGYGCCDAPTRKKGADNLRNSFEKAKADDGAGKLVNDDKGRSCEIVNGAAIARLDIGTCWECHLENRKIGNNPIKGAETRGITDHWAIICTSVDQNGKEAETLIFDLTGGCTDDLKKFRTFWGKFGGTEPEKPPRHNPCPRNPSPSPIE